MNFVLLLGAGFTRNWGGWLASEAFEYLLGSPELDDGLRDLLWKHKDRGGFEAALAELQQDHVQSKRSEPEPRLGCMQKAILRMFADMDAGFSTSDFRFEFSNDRSYRVDEFLVKFDAIFTLNQDTLLEQHYLNENIGLSPAWDGRQFPGMKPAGTETHLIRRWEEIPDGFTVDANLQPIFKLHGSTNWDDSKGEGLLVIGGNKSEAIGRHQILSWYFKQFRGYLSRDNTQLMVIGYGFRDDHVNSAILSAAESSSLRLFIIDALGVDVLDKNRGAAIHDPDILMKKLGSKVIGASRRSLREIFEADPPIEHSKMMRFFDRDATV